MAADLELFISDAQGSRGPLPVEKVRRELSEGTINGKALFRTDGCGAWLAGPAWEALADLLPVPPLPGKPALAPGTSIPADVAECTQGVRERLLWFLSDADGVMGPVTGEFVRRGLESGKVAASAAVCLASSASWIRAPAVFPGALSGATAVRRISLALPCAFCFEPLAPMDTVCGACGEAVRAAPTGMSALRFSGIALVSGAVTLAALAVATFGIRSTGSAPSVPLATSAAPSVSSGAAPSTKPSSGQPGHLAAGQISSTIDVPADATDVFPLPGDRIAVARRAALEVLDAKSGAFAFTTAELGGVRSLHAVGSVIYAVLQSRVAVVDPDSLRVIKWIDLRPSPVGIVAASEENLALAVSPLDQAVAVIDTQRHAEIERFRFDDRLLAFGIAADGKWAVGAPGDPRIQRPGEDGVYVFDPSRLANGQPIKRVFVGDGAVGVAVAPGGTHAAVAVRRSSELVRVPLGAIRPAAGGESPPGSPAQSDELRVKTCKEPETITLAGQSILVGCRGGRALAIHDAATLALRSSLDLGGPVAGIAVAPDGQQALVILRPPASGVAVIDLTPAAAKRVSIPDEITAIRYERAGALGTAFAARRHRVWVLR